MKKEDVLRAIFGDERPAHIQAAAAAARAAELDAADRAEASDLAKAAQSECTHNECADAQWLPALVWDNPAAIAIVGGQVYRAYPEIGGYAEMSEMDINQTEVYTAQP